MYIYLAISQRIINKVFRHHGKMKICQAFFRFNEEQRTKFSKFCAKIVF